MVNTISRKACMRGWVTAFDVCDGGTGDGGGTRWGGQRETVQSRQGYVQGKSRRERGSPGRFLVILVGNFLQEG